MSDYDTDIVQWAERQAALLRDRAAGKLVNDTALDWSNIAEEIEDVGRSHRREVRNRLSVLCQHLLKWAFQPQLRCRSWRATIITQRQELKSVLADAPSLRPFVTEVLEAAYQIGRIRAEQETGVMHLPEAQCPWTAEQVLDDDFYPEIPVA
jgi:hypothetical protein